MIHVTLPDRSAKPLPFYLAMEEFLAARGDDDYFFMWQVEPTVIIGRNQHILTEVNIPYCLEHGIDVVRRKSGGGCVYADMNNVMLSYVTTSDAVTTTFSLYTGMVARMLRQLGIDAHAGGRNDILIGERKVSGNAFYHRHHRAILHGTMLYDTDISAMLQAITPSDVKLTSKGVESVRSRVINIKEVCDIGLDNFKEKAVSLLCDSVLELTPGDISAINDIAVTYRDRRWLYGNSPKATCSVSRHIDGVGQLDISIVLQADIIRDIDIMGDFFLLGDLDSMLLDHIRNTGYTRNDIRQALDGIDASTVIAGLSTEKLIETIL